MASAEGGPGRDEEPPHCSCSSPPQHGRPAGPGSSRVTRKECPVPSRTVLPHVVALHGGRGARVGSSSLPSEPPFRASPPSLPSGPPLSAWGHELWGQSWASSPPQCADVGGRPGPQHPCSAGLDLQAAAAGGKDEGVPGARCAAASSPRRAQAAAPDPSPQPGHLTAPQGCVRGPAMSVVHLCC